MYLDGYKYWLAYKKNKTSYYRCARYKTLCPGRCVVQDAKIRSSTTHNHPPEPDRVLVDKFRKVLTQRASSETIDLYTIYWEEASQRHSEAALLYTFAAAESAMRKARRKQLPQAPNSIEELADILVNSTSFRIHSGSNRDPFYQTSIALEDGICVIFFHMKTIETLGRIEELQLNTSLDTSSMAPMSNVYHLLFFHAVYLHYNVPIVYTILTSRTQSSYAAIFSYIRENLFAYITPNIVMSDYCPDIQSALAFAFPEASIKGYWFNYTDDILHYVKEQGYQSEFARGHGYSALRMILVLPLLPAEYMTPGLEAVRKWANEKQILSSSFLQTCAYVEQSWLRKIGADKMSIFGVPHGVYNHIHQFNRDISGLLNATTPFIWNILEGITHIATRAYIKCNKIVKTCTHKQRNKNQQVLDTIIKNATQLWIRTPVHLRNPLHFLQLASHCINDTFHSSDNQLSESSFSPIQSIGTASSSQVGNEIPKLFRSKTISFSLVRDANADTTEIFGESQIPSLISPGTSVETENNERIPNSIKTSKPTKELKSSTGPPPLAFFPKTAKGLQKPIIFSTTEPPPLVPIRKQYARIL